MITIDPIKRPPKKSSSVDIIIKEVDQKIADLIGEAPENLNTLKELADAVGNINNVNDLLKNYALKSEIPTDYLTEIPSDFITESELNDKGYLTEHQSLNDYAKKSEIPNVSNFITKDTLDVTMLEDILTYGVSWEKEATSPVCTRIGNPLLHKELPIQSQYKGCVYDFASGEFKYWLDQNDWSLKMDGTPSVLDGTDGDVCVHTPKFYGKSGEKDGKYWVKISTSKIDDSWIEIPEMYIGAYRSTVDRSNNKARSIVNTNTQFRGGYNNADYDIYLETDPFRTLLGKPATNISRANMRIYCRNNNSEMLSYEQYKWIFYWNYVIEYANFNSQAIYNSELTSDGYRQGGLGNGLTTWNGTHWDQYNYQNPITPCGYGNDMGNFTGEKSIIIPAYIGRDGSTSVDEKTYNMNRWRGFDNPFGYIWTNLDGIIIKGVIDSENNPLYKEVYTTTNSNNYGDTSDYISQMNMSGIEVYKKGYILEFDLRNTGEIIPSKVEANATTGKCDYHYIGGVNDSLRTLLVGGNANSGGGTGLGSFHSHNGVGDAWHDVGFRQVKELR